MASTTAGIAAVIFDMDGVLIDSEPVWEEVRRAFVAERGVTWLPDAQRRIMGMSTPEWAAFLQADLGVPLPPDDIAAEVIRRMRERYARHLPLIEGARDAVRRMATRWRLGLASSSPRSLIDLALDRAGLAPRFAAVVSTEEAPRGKPAPDVYLTVARKPGAPPTACVAVEDSSNGLRSAAAAGMRVIAAPRPRYPPDPEALALASVVISRLDELTDAAVGSIALELPAARVARAVVGVEPLPGHDTVAVEQEDAGIRDAPLVALHGPDELGVVLVQLVVIHPQRSDDATALVRQERIGDAVLLGERPQRGDGVVADAEEGDAMRLQLRRDRQQLHELRRAVWSPARAALAGDERPPATPRGVQVDGLARLVGQPHVGEPLAVGRPFVDWRLGTLAAHLLVCSVRATG